MKKLTKNQNLQRPMMKQKPITLAYSNEHHQVTATGTCLGDCVKCGASCCMDAGHPGPHFCYLCM